MTGLYLRFDSLEEYAVLDDQQFGRLIRAGLQFAIDGTEPELSPPESYLWPGLRIRIVHNAELYRKKCEQNAANIRKRWDRQRQEQEQETDSAVYDRIRTDTKHTKYKYKDKDKSKDKDMYIGPSAEAEEQPQRQPRPRFTPPTVEEVRTECTAKGYTVNPEAFVDYYTSNGWKVGKNPMKDWKAALRTWQRKEQEGGGKNGLSRTRPADKVPGQRDLYE